MDTQIFTGVIPALMTPCTADRTPDHDALVRKAQELIATSRITKAQARVAAAKPYAHEMTEVLSELERREAQADPR